MASHTPGTERHTQGPWTATIVLTDFGGSIAYIKADTGHKEIAVMYSDEQQTANARLISAAPELLTALKELLIAVKFNKVIYPQPDNPCWDARIPVEFVEAAEAAVSKAEQEPTHA